jgi:glucan phosphoethanolaminetransferase (alkaline phosphatase superfamily)
MEWVAIVLWALIVGLAFPLGAAAIAHPAFGIQVLAVLASFGFIIAFIVFGGDEWMAWAALACSVVAAIAVAAGSTWLVSGDRSVSHLGQRVEETLAAVAGLELPLIGIGILINLGVAVGLTTT